MKRRRTFNSRPRSLTSLANQPRRRPPLEPRRGFGTRGMKRSTPSWWTPECEEKRGVECRACGFIPPGGPELHHIVPRSLSRAGRSDPRNLVPLCSPCHDQFTAGGTLPRSILTDEEAAFAQEIAPSIGWPARRYPRSTDHETPRAERASNQKGPIDA